MDKSRQQFEEEFKDCNSLDVDDPFRIWDEINDYYYLETRQAWFWWQASRESLEVELPDSFIANETWCYDEDLVNQALISNGVKIKNE
ncbi:hypothetical protein [Providencia huashanensis]|uniref:hypothetical protein n=1 Tax=Providencia huashanensis TaxID=3037798 RepID=UPI003D2B241C